MHRPCLNCGMKLSDYIREVTPEGFAKRFGGTPRAAIAYMYGARIPRPKLARRIVGQSPVTWEGIYGKPISRRRENAMAANQ